MIGKLVLWLDERLGGAPFVRAALRKAFPDHWSFMLGEIAAYCFMFIVASGIYLALFFVPSDHVVTYRGPVHSLDGRTMNAAYASVLKLSFETTAGLLIRQAHHWCALVFAAAVVTHMTRIFLTGAFRKPRELNWVIGLSMFLLVILAGFTGYSLPGDLLSGTGLRIADSIALSMPLIGNWFASLFFGGAFPGPQMTNRLYLVHVFLVPATIAALLGAHVAIVWRQKHTQFSGARRREDNVRGSPLWPHYALKSVALMLGVFGVPLLLGGLVQINPVWLYGPYDPWTIASPSQPDWYVGWLEGALRIGPAVTAPFFGHKISPLFWPALAMPAVLFGFLYVWPWLERSATFDRRRHELLQFPQEAPLRTAFGVALLTFGGMLLLAGGDDVQARVLRISVQALAWFYRFAVWIVPLFAGALAWRVCLELQARDRTAGRRPQRVLLVRNAEGGYRVGGGYDEEPRGA